MPTYEYACTSCGQHVEVFQRLTDDPLTECGVCGGALRKVFHPAGILFRGSGFYATDNRSKPKTESPAKEGAASSGGSSDGSSGKDAGASKKDAAKPSSSDRSAGSSGSSGSSPSKPAGERSA